jgi:SAM-dependent methyltransferase
LPGAGVPQSDAVTALWPLPALCAWGLGWGVFAGLRWLGAPLVVAIFLAVVLGAALSVLGNTAWRRIFVAAGFPLSLAASGVAGAMPAWGWLLPLAVLLLMYPINAWRDAPLFPTPTGALQGLAPLVELQANARVLDAGCGLGAGLRELHRAYPQADIHGMEWSWPLRWICALRCRFARVRRADIWAADWSGFDLVYLFQRPESLPRAVEKARRELRPGAWLASLEFDAKDVAPTRVLACEDGRRVWLYQMPAA